MNKVISIQESNPELSGKENELFSDICRIIDGARDRIATNLNAELCLTNWYIGHRINEEVLYNQSSTILYKIARQETSFRKTATSHRHSQGAIFREIA